MLKTKKKEEILEIKIDREKDNELYLTQMGIDSIKLVELSAFIEEEWDIIIKEDHLFDIKIKHLFLAIDEFKFVILDELDPKLKKYTINNNSQLIMGGYCSLLRSKNLISSMEYFKLLKYKDLYLRDESLYKNIKQEMLLFIAMSRICVDKIKYDEQLFEFFKIQFQPIQMAFQKVNLENISTCEDFFQKWAKFNAKIIFKIDPTLNIIPKDICEKTVVVKYL